MIVFISLICVFSHFVVCDGHGIGGVKEIDNELNNMGSRSLVAGDPSTGRLATALFVAPFVIGVLILTFVFVATVFSFVIGILGAVAAGLGTSFGRDLNDSLVSRLLNLEIKFANSEECVERIVCEVAKNFVQHVPAASQIRRGVEAYANKLLWAKKMLRGFKATNNCSKFSCMEALSQSQ